jgi:hypothetical protein
MGTELRETMRATGWAIYEGTVADQLLADLADASATSTRSPETDMPSELRG